MSVRPVAAAVVLLIALSGCGGGSSKAKATSAGPPDKATSTVAITKAWESFFEAGGSIASHAALLQDGPRFTAELTKSSKDPAAKNISAKVTKVAITGLTAAVTYNLIGKGGVVLLKGAGGSAVYESGSWKVSNQTFCSLVKLQDPTAKHAACA